MIKPKDLPMYEKLRAMYPDIIGNDSLEVCYIFKTHNMTFVTFMNSKTGKIESNRNIIAFSNGGYSRSMYQLDYGKLNDAFNKFLENDEIFEEIKEANYKSIVHPSMQSIYDISSVYFVKETSVPIQEKLKLKTAHYQGEDVPVFYLVVSSYNTDILLTMHLPIQYDIGKVLKYFPNRELLAGGARYRFDIDKSKKKYEKKILDLENKIQELRNEMQSAFGDIDCDEVDNRLFEYFEKDKIDAQRLFKVLKEM